MDVLDCPGRAVRGRYRDRTMNASVRRPPWSPWRWIVVTGVACLLQAGLIYLVSRSARPPAGSSGSPVLELGWVRWEDASRPAGLLVGDPSSLARVHRHGFSGPLWKRILSPESGYEPLRLEPRYYLGSQALADGAYAAAAGLGSAFSPAPSAVSMPVPILTASERPESGFPAASTVRFTGAIQARLPAELPPLRRWPEAESLRPTVVSVAIDRFGWPQSLAVLSNSRPGEGLSEPDAWALAWLRRFRFESSRETRREWGRAVFHWSFGAAGNEAAP